MSLLRSLPLAPIACWLLAAGCGVDTIDAGWCGDGLLGPGEACDPASDHRPCPPDVGCEGCSGGLSLCSAACVDIATDSNHCGGCNEDCSPTEQCVAGHCTPGCDDGLVACDGACVDPLSHPRYCGASGDCAGANRGTECADGEVCDGTGNCAVSCQDGLLDCDGECLPVCPDPNWVVGYDPARGADDDPDAPNPYGGAIYYIATDGADADDGLSPTTPWATFHHANTQVAAGDLVYVRGGIYSEYVVIGGVGSNPNGYSMGTSAAPITWRSYPGEYAIVDGTGGQVVTSVVRFYGVSWNVLQNFELRNSVASGLVVGQGSTDNTFSNIWTHDHLGSGQGASDSSRNRYIYITSEDNYDEPTLGENADGFAVSNGGDNEFLHCLARHNSDDGFDFWESTGNTARYCVATDNGYGPDGNGNGFKLGGATAGGGNLVEYCVGYENLNSAFSSNTGSGNVPNTIHHCTAYATVAPTGRNFRMYGEAHVLRNNLEYQAAQPVHVEDIVDDEFNSWNLGLSLTDGDFQSLDPLDLATAFLRPSPTSPALDAGTDVGLPYSGSAPDLGAFELPE